jgi:hypothetical protein
MLHGIVIKKYIGVEILTDLENLEDFFEKNKSLLQNDFSFVRVVDFFNKFNISEQSNNYVYRIISHSSHEDVFTAYYSFIVDEKYKVVLDSVN